MNESLTNLLPGDRKKAIRRLYMIRLASVGILFASFLVFSTAIMRIPVYLYQYQEIGAGQQELTSLTTRLNDTQGKEVAVRFKSVNDNITYLSRLASSTGATAVTSSILAINHPGVVFSGFSYTPGKGIDEKMTLTGKASTREALHQYVSALTSQSSGKNADLPISAYAKESDIPFTVTLTGPLTP